MSRKNGKKTVIYGFEDYALGYVNEDILFPNGGFYYSEPYWDTNDSLLPFDIYPSDWVDAFGAIVPDKLCTNHADLLGENKKVYIHPACKISRTMVSSKYKKCLNPWLADVVVIPEPKGYISTYTGMLLVNEEKKRTFCIHTYDDRIKEQAKNIEQGTKFYKIMKGTVPSGNEKAAALLDADFYYFGTYAKLPNNSLIFDLLNQSLPLNKIVFEESLQNTLGSEENKLTYESAVSIYEMLSSTDPNTVSAALKSLAMMDWMHYPNSIKYIFERVDNDFKYNHAVYSTAVKFMFTNLSGKTNRHYWPGYYNNDIYEADYQLFRKLQTYIDKIPEDTQMNFLKDKPFMYIGEEGCLKPRLKVS